MNASVMRILDANLNRAREALRVVEDYARFALDDATLCGELKQIRHELADATRAVAPDAILHRDTPGDVGTDAKTAAEMRRDDVRDVVVAAGKRLGEALRVVEEMLKTIDAERASRVEKLRYRAYDVEHRLAFALRPPAGAFASVRLYVLITESACRHDWYETARQAILGGADCLQLREKALEGAELLRRATRVVELCHAHHVPAIVNDRPDVAVLSGADGVHVGQDDLPAREVCKLIGRDRIVGVSTQDIEQARQAVRDGADYIGVGPVFRSPTKPREILPGPEFAREVVRTLGEKIPAVAIAGINESNVDEVRGTGVRAIAVTAAVTGADDPKAAARRLKEKLTTHAP